jgi:hypothetical protein
MANIFLTRREVLVGTLAMTALPDDANASEKHIKVLKDPNCGCCSEWAEILTSNGFTVKIENMPNSLLVGAKMEAGVPPSMASCHTAFIDSYVIEGHVPVADIKRLLFEMPKGMGLAVPGMPYGSPGMGPEDKREAYDVMLMQRDGSSSVFSRYTAQARI